MLQFYTMYLPTAMLVKELSPNIFDGRKWYYHDTPLYDIDQAKAQEFNHLFEAKQKEYQASQEEFYIHSHSVIQ